MNEMLLLAELLKKHRLETQEKDKRIAELKTVLKRLLDVTLWVDSGCKQLGAAEQAAREALREQDK